MPDLASGVLATPGLTWLLLAFLVAGLVRGFTGFGGALIVMPVATLFLPVAQAIALIVIAGMITWPLILPRALRRAEKREVLTMALTAVIGAPLGVWVLGWADRDVLRWGVALAAALTLAALVSGWRYHRRLGPGGLGLIGAAAGLLGGTTGLAGPPVIIFYLASTRGADAVRANTILFLAILSLGLLANLVLQQGIGWGILPLAALLALPYGIGIAAGQYLFHPSRERLYRRFAYLVIAGSILAGLPLFH